MKAVIFKGKSLVVKLFFTERLNALNEEAEVIEK
jgi:hypothetical protein